MAVASNPLETFIWGAGGQKMSPEQVARQREIAAALMQGGMDYSPVDHWLQGAARASQGLVGGLKERWAGEAEQRGREGFQSQWDSVLGVSASPVAAALAETTPALDAANQMAGAPVTDWLEYANQGATRNQPLAPELVNAMSFLPEMGVTMRVVSGGQEASGPNRVGSTRHDHGNAGDVDFYQNGRKLDWNNEADLPILSNIVSRARANGVTGIGAGDDYMGAGRFHIGFGNEAVWGAGGKSENAPDWLRAAYGGAPAPARTQVAQAGGGMGPYGAGDTSLERFGPDGERFTRSSPNEPWNRASNFGGGGGGQSGGNPSVAQLLSLAGNEWASPGQSSVVNALLGQAMQQQDPRYQQQLAMGNLDMQRAQLELDALRNPAAPAPVFEGGQWWDLSGGAPNALTGRAIDPTAGMQNYEYLIAQGVSPEEAAVRAFSGGVTVNTGDQGPQVGTIPPSMALVPDETNPTGFRMELIPGSPEALAQEAAAAASELGAQNTGRTANIVREDIGRIRDLVENSTWFNPAVGFGADLAQSIAGSNASNVAALSKTVLANIGFDRLQQMRDASPTGGALGAISDRELGTLQAVMGNLEQSQSVEQFTYNLDRLGTIYDELLTKAAAYPNSSQFGFEQSAQTNQSQPPRFNSQSEYNAAPSGTVFTAPDGSIRVKP